MVRKEEVLVFSTRSCWPGNRDNTNATHFLEVLAIALTNATIKSAPSVAEDAGMALRRQAVGYKRRITIRGTPIESEHT
jgi:hypothetical protein